MDTVTQLQSAVVTAAHGEVFLLLDGKRIALSSGDRLPAGSMIETGTDGLLQARNGAGHVVELAANQSVTLAPSGEWGEPSELGHLDPEIAELQQAIAQGEDPTLNFDAPAAGAGEGTGGGGASNSGYVELARDGGATLAEAGFDTAYAKGTEEERPDWLGLRDILTGEDPAPEIGAPSIGSTVHTVYEAELAGGSAHQPGQGAVIQGTFSVELHGLSGEVQIRDQRFTLDADGNVTLPEGGLQIETGAGILHITAIRDGVITYSYQLKEAQSHAPGEGNNTLLDTIPLTVTDSRGESASGSLDVTIVDDVPSITVTDAQLSVNEGYAVDGSFSHALGADAAGATLTVEGATLQADGRWELTHGFITLDPVQGTFTFTAKPNAPQGAKQDIVLVVTDGDGDVAKGAVTIEIGKSVAPEIAPILVDEQGLTSEQDNSESAIIAVPDGYTVINVSGAVNGTLSQNEQGEWVYTLNQSLTHSGAGRDQREGDVLTVVVQDGQGNEHTLEVPVTVVDDVPSITVTDAQLSVNEGYAVDGSFSHALGADAAGATLTVEGATLQADGRWELTHGFVTLDPVQGTFTFTAKPNAPQGAKQDIVLVVTDGDGDVAKGAVTIEIGKCVAPEIAPILVDEQGLTSVQDNSESAIIAVPDGYTVINVSGAVNGTLSQNEQGEWVYTLNQSLAHSGAGRDQREGDVLTVVVQDGQGNEHTLEVPVTVVDDVPIATIDRVQVTDTDTGNYYGNVITGQWGTTNVSADWTQISGDADTLGADGASVTHVRMHTPEGSETYIELKPQDSATGDDRLYAVVETEQGTLTLYSDGSYEFNPTYQTIFDPTDTQGGHAESVNGKNTTTLGDYTFTAVNVVLSSDHSFNDIEYDSDLKFDVPGGKGSLGIKGDAGGGPENSQIDGQGDKKGEANDGVKVDFPDAASAIQFDLVYFEPGETVGWAVFDTDGHVIDSGTYTRTTDNKPILEINSDAPFNSVVIYAVGENTAFNIGAISVATGTVTEDVSFDYVLTDGDGDSSESQLEFVVDKPGQTQGRAAVTARFVAPEPEPTGAFSHLQALIAGRLGVGVEALTLTMMLGYIQQHAGELDVKVSEAMAAEGPLVQEIAQGDALLVSADMSDGAVNAGAEMVAFLGQLQHLTGAVSADPDLLLQTIQSMEVDTLGEVARELELVSFKGGANPLLQGGRGMRCCSRWEPTTSWWAGLAMTFWSAAPGMTCWLAAPATTS